jgi:hypothetical protein
MLYFWDDRWILGAVQKLKKAFDVVMDSDNSISLPRWDCMVTPPTKKGTGEGEAPSGPGVDLVDLVVADRGTAFGQSLIQLLGHLLSLWENSSGWLHQTKRYAPDAGVRRTASMVMSSNWSASAMWARRAASMRSSKATTEGSDCSNSDHKPSTVKRSPSGFRA